jgi:phenylpropionate dioxygenase-like ring-hydroxylating dioxygenase large terminal subunit
MIGMIKDMWYGILESKELGRNMPVGVVRMGEKLVLWRTEKGEIKCISDICCHRGASLSCGKLEHGEVICPFHGFAYDGTGRVVKIPANGLNTPVGEQYRVKAYKVVEKQGFVWLWYGPCDEAKGEPPFFEDLMSGFSHGGFSETWAVHYTRAIENQLDVVHLPFVHGNSIGRGNKTLVNGPVVTWEENLMTFYVDNTQDDGKTQPLKPTDIKNYKELFSLQLQLPNLWQNRINEKVRIVAVFAPIDESSTKIYIQFYQKFMRVPGLKQLVNFLSNPMNKYILHQDRRVVLTQLPIKSEFKMDEKLIQGDLPIIEFRRRRAKLKGELDTDKA